MVHAFDMFIVACNRHPFVLHVIDEVTLHTIDMILKWYCCMQLICFRCMYSIWYFCIQTISSDWHCDHSIRTTEIYNQSKQTNLVACRQRTSSGGLCQGAQSVAPNPRARLPHFHQSTARPPAARIPGGPEGTWEKHESNRKRMFDMIVRLYLLCMIKRLIPS